MWAKFVIRKGKVEDWNIINNPACYLWQQTITDNVSKDYWVCEIAVCYGNIGVDRCYVT
jgi:hypothetical protein